MKLFEQKCWST